MDISQHICCVHVYPMPLSLPSTFSQILARRHFPVADIQRILLIFMRGRNLSFNAEIPHSVRSCAVPLAGTIRVQVVIAGRLPRSVPSSNISRGIRFNFHNLYVCPIDFAYAVVRLDHHLHAIRWHIFTDRCTLLRKPDLLWIDWIIFVGIISALTPWWGWPGGAGRPRRQNFCV